LTDTRSFKTEALPLAETDGTPIFEDCLRIWNARPDGGLPGKAQVDALTLRPATLPWIEIIDVERGDGEPRFRYRLTGTGIDVVQNRNLTGTYIDEHEPRVLRDTLRASLIAMLNDPAPQLAELCFTNPTGNNRCLRSLRVPLAAKSGGARVDHILVAVRLL
jgi:hypothetical protein